jgi:acyl carrier protein
VTQPTETSIATAVREILAEILEAPLAEIPQDASLKRDLDVDSLQQLELVGMLEERFGVLLDADDLSEAGSIQELAELAARKLGPAG